MTARATLRSVRAGMILAGVLCMALAVGATAATQDRLSITANGSTLSQDHGGGGAAIGILHNFNENSLLGAEVEYETIANSHWTFASLSGSTTHGPAGRRVSFFGELHEGAGDIGAHAFHYSIVAGGVSGTFGSRFSVQVEDRQIDVDTTHGNLPKLSLSYFVTPSLQSGIAYAHSVSGNLGTNLVSVRIDRFAAPFNWFAGGATGKASPEVVNLKTGIAQPGQNLREGYLGASKALAGGKFTLVVDYLNLGGIKRATVTANYIIELGGGGRAR